MIGQNGRRLRRRPSRTVRRNRTVATALVLVVVAAIAVGWASQGAKPAATRPGKQTVVRAKKSDQQTAGLIPDVDAQIMPWSLAAPLSRMVVEPSTGTRLTILGGYDGAASAAGVYALDTTDGQLRLVGNLAQPTHDAAGAVLGGRDLVIGGGDVASDPGVQALVPGPGAPTATTIGRLPAARSDCVAVSVGPKVYVVGGYDGTNGDPSVLATVDGTTYLSVGILPLPVRYPAVAVLGGSIYVIGGEVVGGPDNGAATGDIQVVNPLTGSAHILTSMPQPIEGASAFTIAGHIYVAGGNTPSTGSRTNTSPAIWAFDPLTRRMLRAGTLRVAVSNAGFAVLGTTAWLVGGETGGVVSSAVQMFRPDPRLGTAGAVR